MATANKKEVWLRGPLKNCPALLQPVAHALLQAREEVHQLLQNFRDEQLWNKPAGAASVGFHLQHLTGVLDRLFTYANGKSLNEVQLQFLSEEGQAISGRNNLSELLRNFDLQVDYTLQQIYKTDTATLTEVRLVGRSQIPSTVIGLLFHAAEHTMRHVGQMLVTVKVIQSSVPTDQA